MTEIDAFQVDVAELSMVVIKKRSIQNARAVSMMLNEMSVDEWFAGTNSCDFYRASSYMNYFNM